MTFPRFLLLVLAILTGGPWLATEARVQLLGADAQGFERAVDDRPYDIAIAQARYNEPISIGQTHVMVDAPLGEHGPIYTRQYHTLGPKTGAQRPAIVLLHGAGRSGRSMLDMWKDLAASGDVVLIAPDAAIFVGFSLLGDGHFVAERLLKDAAQHHPIDMENVYLVGHSMGGKMALRLANLGWGPWRAVDVHAAALWTTSVMPARNPIPVHIRVGENEATYPVDKTIATGKRMAQAGHEVTVSVVPRHNHWYYRIAPQLAPVMWQDLQAAAAARDTRLAQR